MKWNDVYFGHHKKMKKQHILLSESKDYGWVAGFVTLEKAKRCLKMKSEVFYLFRCNHTKNPFEIKLKYPFCENYSSLTINEYKEWEEKEGDKYVILTYNESCDENCLIVSHHPPQV